MTTLKVFIGSPNDIAEVRELLKSLVAKMNRSWAPGGLRVEATDYQDLFLNLQGIQSHINRFLGDSDLIILVFRYRLGQGALEEYEVGRRLAEAGLIHNMLLYFFAIPDELVVNPTLATLELLDFRKRLTHGSILTHEVDDSEDLLRLVEIHLSRWIAQEQEILACLTDIREKYLPDIDRGLLQTMKVQDTPYTDEIIGLRELDESDRHEAEERAYRQYLGSEDFGSASPAFYYLIASYLLRAIQGGDFGACKHKQFLYPIHLYLSQLVRKLPEVDRGRCIMTLIGWLAESDVFETARNFAAFELGMIGARDAGSALFAVLGSDNELGAVRYYAALSIGAIGRRDFVKPLYDIYLRCFDENVKRAIAHAILFIGNVGGVRRPAGALISSDHLMLENGPQERSMSN